MRNINPNWRKPVAALLLMLTATACQHRPLVVRPAEPLPAPTVTVPRALTDPVPIPAWLSPEQTSM